MKSEESSGPCVGPLSGGFGWLSDVTEGHVFRLNVLFKRGGVDVIGKAYVLFTVFLRLPSAFASWSDGTQVTRELQCRAPCLTDTVEARVAVVRHVDIDALCSCARYVCQRSMETLKRICKS